MIAWTPTPRPFVIHACAMLIQHHPGALAQHMSHMLRRPIGIHISVLEAFTHITQYYPKPS